MLAGAALIGTATASAPPAAREADAIAAWLPRAEGAGPWRSGHAVRSSVADELAIVRFGSGAPHDWTHVVRTRADASGFDVTYDPAHRIVLYITGCCTYQEIVLASGTRPPPAAVAARDFSGLRTRYGLSLGASMRAVRAVYGAAPARGVAFDRTLTALHYQRKRPADRCMDAQNLYFRRGRLAMIDYYHGC